jgi:hypothetical protein
MKIMETQEKLTKQNEIYQWLNKYDPTSDLMLDFQVTVDMSVLYNGKLSSSTKLVFIHLSSLPQPIVSSDKEISDALQIDIDLIRHNLFELDDNNLIKIFGTGDSRSIEIILDRIGPIDMVYMTGFLNQGSARVEKLVQDGLINNPAELWQLAILKRFNILKKEKARKDFWKALNQIPLTPNQ